MKTTKKLWLGLIVLIILSPLGLILPARFGAGTAWGEWSVEELGKLVGYVPAGLRRLSDIWKAPMPDYAPKGHDNPGLATSSLYYVISAILGVALVCALAFALGRILRRKDGSDASGVDED